MGWSCHTGASEEIKVSCYHFPLLTYKIPFKNKFPCKVKVSEFTLGNMALFFFSNNEENFVGTLPKSYPCGISEGADFSQSAALRPKPGQVRQASSLPRLGIIESNLYFF